MRFNDNKLGLDTVSDSEQGRQVGVQRGGGGGVVVGRCAIERGYMMKEVGRSRVWSVTSKSHHTQFHPILLFPRTSHSTTNHNQNHVHGISADLRLALRPRTGHLVSAR